MKTVKLSLLAVVVATAVSPSAFAGDTVEAATTELAAIQPGMSQAEIDQKIGRFLERTGNSAAAQNYLIAHDYQTTTPQENTAASPVQPTNTLNPITNQAQTDRDNGQDTDIQDAQHAITVAQTDIDANTAAITDTRNDVSAVQSDVTTIKGDVAHAQSTADHASANANTALMNGVKLSRAVTENKNNIEQNRSDIADQQQQLDETRKTVAATGDVQTAARYQSMIDARQTAAANAQQEQADTQQTDIDANKAAIAATRNDVSAVQSDVTNIKGDVAHAQSTADHANANANTALMNGVKLSGAVTENKNNIEQNRSDIADQQKLLASNEQKQIVRDNGQDTAIQDAQHAANWASLKADDAQHAITVAQTDIDANKAAIADTRNDVSAVQSDVTNIKGDVAHAQSTADHANANANTALMNGVKLSGAVTENKNNIEQNRSDIADQQQQLDETRKTVAATGDVQTAARYQSMIDARQTAAANAQQEQADTQQQQMDDQQKQIDATQKTVSALGDAQTNAHYQEMVNAGLRAQNDANARTAAEQKQKIDTLATNQATQQHIDSVQYGEQIQRLAQDSTQTHEQIDSLTQDVNQTHQQLSNTQKRVADNSQQITTLNNHFSSLKNEVEDNRKEANAGTASAIAIASQPQVKAGDFMMVSAGAGTFNGESAVSVGTSFNAGTHTVIKAGVSADTQSDFGAGVGVGYSF
ncbi:YadA-like family protein [Escherichia coli]|nr:YadA-like family protein [Escherichia coli]